MRRRTATHVHLAQFGGQARNHPRASVYRPDATAHVWAAFLEKVLPNEDIRHYLRRVIGVALLGKVIEHNLAIATGK